MIQNINYNEIKRSFIVINVPKVYTLTIVVARWCMRMSGCVSGILDRMSVYLGQPENSMAGKRTTAISPVVFGPDMRNLTHCASSTTAILKSLGSGNLLDPVLPAFNYITIHIYQMECTGYSICLETVNSLIIIVTDAR